MSLSADAQRLFAAGSLVAVATGYTSGVGAMITRTLATNGASASYILGHEDDALEDIAKQLIDSDIHLIVCVVTSKAHLQFAVHKIIQECGHINLLNCSAGIAPPKYNP